MTAVTNSLDLRKIRISALNDATDISKFRCGVQQMDSWINRKGRKYHEKNRSKVFCAQQTGNSTVLGLYELSLSFEDSSALVPEHRDLYKSAGGFPAVYIGHLAVLRSCQCQGLGTLLLMNALQRSYYVSKHVSFYGVALRSLNDRTTQLYLRYGFVKREEAPYPLMILPIWSLWDLIEKNA